MKIRHMVALLMLLWWAVGMIVSELAGDWPAIASIAFVVIGVVGGLLWMME